MNHLHPIPLLRRWRRGLAESPRGLLAAMLLVAGGLKVWLGLDMPILSGDGGYYANVAMHLARGDGFVTDLSLMHKGYDRFPHPSEVYPIWPLLYGGAARILGLKAAGVVIPSAAYLVTLWAAYLWGNLLFPPRILARWPALRAGHVAALAFAIDGEFFWFTSLPYTEGIGYAALCGALVLAHRRLSRPGMGSGALLGLVSAVLVLIRSQFLLYALAVGATLALAFLFQPRRRRLYLATAAAFVAAAAAACAPWLAYLASRVTVSPLTALLRFDLARPNDILSPLSVMVPTSGPIDWLFDRLQGFVAAFSPSHRYAYARHAWLLPYALPAAAFFGWRRIRSRPLAPAVASLLANPARTPVLFQLIFAAGGFFSLHAIHKKMWHPWNFHVRHALTATFLFSLCLVWLLRRPGAPRRTAVALLAGSSWIFALEVPTMVRKAEATAAEPFRPQLARWLREKKAEHGELVVVAPNVQRMWPFTPGVGYHRYYERATKPADVLAMVHRLGARYVITCGRNRRRFDARPAFQRRFARLTRIDGCTIYAPREDAPPDRRPQTRPPSQKSPNVSPQDPTSAPP